MATKKDSTTHYVIGCRLPTGIILEHPFDAKKTVKLNGLNRIVIMGAGYATTPVEADFWEHWKMVHKDFPALKTGAIFEAGTIEDAAAVAAELAKEKTGFEKMPQKSKDIKSAKDD